MTKALFLKQNQKAGELYAGLILGKKGKPDYHLFRVKVVPDLTWAEAEKYAAANDLVQANRNELRMLFVNCAEHFEPRAHWSSEQDAHSSDYAWCQGFYHGLQSFNTKSSRLSAVFVRRLVIL